VRRGEPIVRHSDLEADDGVRLRVTHFSGGGRRLIVLAPGFWRRRADRENVFVARHLAHRGYDVASFDFRGHGDSEGHYGFGTEEWRDFLAVAEAFRPTHPEIAALGFSMGGSIAADAMVRRPDLPWRALIMVSAPSDLVRLRPRPWKAAAWKMMSLGRATRPPRVDWRRLSEAKPRAEAAVAQLRIPKLIVTLEDDWLVRPSHGDRLQALAAEPVERSHLAVGRSLHADAIVRFAPVAFLGVVGEFLGRHFPPDGTTAPERADADVAVIP
jgi:pimeloyl-ACP methyl ester carboxylesterase